MCCPGGVTRAALEERRFAALELFRNGASQAEVARAFGVSRTTTHRWGRLRSTPDELKANRALARAAVAQYTAKKKAERVHA